MPGWPPHWSSSGPSTRMLLPWTGGDFSIGSLVQTLYTTRAAELRTMGALGYDATTAGNHEFDHTGLGFAQMLTAAYTSGDPLPALLMANYAPSAGGPDQLDIQRACRPTA